MIRIPGIHGKSIAVFGLGKAGRAGIESLLASGAAVHAWDDSEVSRNALAAHASLYLAPPNDWPWSILSFLCLSPGIPLTHPVPHPVVTRAKESRVEILGEVELLARAVPEATLIGITGTNGKSTTTALIGHILTQAGRKVQVGGNLGTPALALEPLGKDGTYVLEMSSYQLDLVHAARFHVALMLNLTPDHLDRHGDMQGYIKAKRRLFQNQQANDTAIIATDDAPTAALAETLQANAKRQVVKVSTAAQSGHVTVDAKGVLHDAASSLAIDISGIPTLTGRHNWQNAAAAYAATRAVGIKPETIAQALQSYGGLAHRLERVGTVQGVRFVNDSKATNADATQHALAAFDSIYWIAGGKAKAGGIESLSGYFPKILHAFLIGEAEESFAKTLEGKLDYTRCHTLEAATEAAAAMAWQAQTKDAVVLLSPACASFDQWASFEARGDAFRAQVHALRPPASIY